MAARKNNRTGKGRNHQYVLEIRESGVKKRVIPGLTRNPEEGGIRNPGVCHSWLDQESRGTRAIFWMSDQVRHDTSKLLNY